MKSAIAAACVTAALCLPAAPALAGTTADVLMRECGSQLRLSASACDCIGKKAEADLSEKEQAFVVAAITKDRARQQVLQQQMTVAEMTKAGNFMTGAPGACSR